MQISYFDDARFTEKALTTEQKKLVPYRTYLKGLSAAAGVPEVALVGPKNPELHEALALIGRQYRQVKTVILVGIGGSSLGVEAIHMALPDTGVRLVVLDAIAPHRFTDISEILTKVKKSTDIVLCVTSKSGATTETLTNGSIVLDMLVERFGEEAYRQVVVIGDPDTKLMRLAKRKGMTRVPMPVSVGGRFSVGTAVGLVPLTLLKHPVDDFVEGFLDAEASTLEAVTADAAARLALYIRANYTHYNFFAFEPRLVKLAEWYRQLCAESLGKVTSSDGVPVRKYIVPTISTPTELHSIAQLYLSGVAPVYTDFVSFDDDSVDVNLPRLHTFAPELKRFTVQEVATALYGGVISAYQERQLPYRATVFEENIPYMIGQFMAMRMREVMYVAKLLNVDAFTQPNVEIYKEKTRSLLSL